MTEQTQLFRKIWGRKKARPLKTKHKDLMATLLPSLHLEVHPGETIPVTEKTWVEIGFGGGEHLAFQAEAHPNINLIGCEPFINGVASLLTHIDEKALTNVRIVMDDARLLLAALPAQSVDRIFVLFPDPWQKKRHHKRRIVNTDTVQQMLRILTPNGRLHMATDIADYAQWMQEILAQFPEFSLTLDGRSDVHERPTDWPKTRYEEKGEQAGRSAAYMVYTKK